MNKQENFLQKVYKQHSLKYDYSLLEYISSRTKIKIICKLHGIFEQEPANHIRGQGCPSCAGVKNNTKNKFVSESNIIHNNIYDYSLVEYKNNKTKVKIICSIHGVFECRPDNHKNKKSGCPKCANNQLYTQEEYINRCNKIHNNKYDYSSIKYKNGHNKIIIICPVHGEYTQMAYSHLSGVGCSMCNDSKGEKKISEILKDSNIEYIRQKRFIECRNKNSLPFDFYLPEYNICIEYDGIQHFMPIENWGGIESFKYIKLNDKIKDKFCIKNNIKLLRIKYNDNIIKKLKF